MTHYLYIVRHAQTYADQYYNTDKERELKPEGILQARQLGSHLNEFNDSIEIILASDAVRAKSTASLIANAINYPIDQIKFATKIYSGSMNDLVNILHEIPESIQQVLIVGHNPTILELINFLSDTKKASMSTCELTKLSISTNWDQLVEGCGHVISSYLATHQ